MLNNPIMPKRTFRRSRVRLKTQARSDDVWFDVRVLDLSINGARLESVDPPSIGVDIHLVHDDLEVRCRVTWIDGHKFGVEFHFPLDPVEVPASMLAGAVLPATPE